MIDLMYSISKLSKITGISPSTLRFYDNKGVLIPEHRNAETGYRYYSEKQLLQVQMIKNMRMLGLSLADIRTILQLENITLIRQKINELMKRMEWQLNAFDQLHTYLSEGESMLSLNLDQAMEGLPNTYLCGVYTMPGTYVLSLRGQYAYTDSFFTRVCLEIQTLRDSLHLLQVGSLMVRLHDGYEAFFTGENCDMELCMPIYQPDITLCDKLCFFPEVQVVSIINVGKWEEPQQAYHILLNWLERNSYRVSGEPILQFLLEPCDTMDTEQYITRLNLPIEKVF